MSILETAKWGDVVKMYDGRLGYINGIRCAYGDYHIQIVVFNPKSRKGYDIKLYNDNGVSNQKDDNLCVVEVIGPIWPLLEAGLLKTTSAWSFNE